MRLGAEDRAYHQVLLARWRGFSAQAYSKMRGIAKGFAWVGRDRGQMVFALGSREIAGAHAGLQILRSSTVLRIRSSI